MKKLTTILILISFYASAVGWNMYGSSFSYKVIRNENQTTITFNDSGTVELGTEQFLKVKGSGGFNSGDWLTLTIQHVNANGSLSDKDTLIRTQYDLYYTSLPVEPDGTRKIKFTLPASYKSGKFLVTWAGYTTDKVYGRIAEPAPTGLEEEYLANPANIKEVFYFTPSGQQIQNPEQCPGIVIEKRVYLNGKVFTRKSYKTN
jgi:hypothetical protein